MISGLRLSGIFALGMGIFGSMMLPSHAGEYRAMHGNFPRHAVPAGDHGHFVGHGLMRDHDRFATAARGFEIRGGHAGFGHSWQPGGRDRFAANHPRRLQRLYSGDFYTARGSGITVQLNDRPDYDTVSNAGASDSYSTAAGTYSVGYGDYLGERNAPQVTAPMAKIIDVATMKNACAYENGVCVIRP